MSRINNISELKVSDDVKKLNPQLTGETKRASKYGNIKTESNGMTFDSGREAVRVSELILLEEQKLIFGLRLQVRFPLPGKVTYVADFTYAELVNGKLEFIVGDAKAWDKKTGKFLLTPEYKMKKKLFEETYGIKILES